MDNPVLLLLPASWDRWMDNVSGDEVVRALSPALLLWSLMYPRWLCFTVSEILHCLLTYSLLSLSTLVCNWNRTLPSGISLRSALALTSLYFLWTGRGLYSGGARIGLLVSNSLIDEEKEKGW